MKPEQRILITIGKNIRQAREAKGLSQKRLSLKCDMDKASMSRIEAGKTNITMDTLYRVSVILELHLGDFFKETLDS